MTSVLWEGLFCADLLNIDKSEDTRWMSSAESTGRLLFATTATSDGGCFPQVAEIHTRVTKPIRKHACGSCFIQTGFISLWNEGGETNRRGGDPGFLRADKTTTAEHSGNNRVRRGYGLWEDEMYERITMRSWKQKPGAISYSYGGMDSVVLHTGTSIRNTDEWKQPEFPFSKSFILTLSLTVLYVNLLNVDSVVSVVITLKVDIFADWWR